MLNSKKSEKKTALFHKLLPIISKLTLKPISFVDYIFDSIVIHPPPNFNLKSDYKSPQNNLCSRDSDYHVFDHTSYCLTIHLSLMNNVSFRVFDKEIG